MKPGSLSAQRECDGKEKTAEGIRLFAADAVKLQTYLADRLK